MPLQVAPVARGVIAIAANLLRTVPKGWPRSVRTKEWKRAIGLVFGELACYCARNAAAIENAAGAITSSSLAPNVSFTHLAFGWS